MLCGRDIGWDLFWNLLWRKIEKRRRKAVWRLKYINISVFFSLLLFYWWTEWMCRGGGHIRRRRPLRRFAPRVERATKRRTLVYNTTTTHELCFLFVYDRGWGGGVIHSYRREKKKKEKGKGKNRFSDVWQKAAFSYMLFRCCYCCSASSPFYTRSNNHASPARPWERRWESLSKGGGGDCQEWEEERNL